MPDTRAVTRQIEPGSEVLCALDDCRERVKFQAKKKNRQVICNVYEEGKWNRTDHFHEECYETAGRPYGDPDESRPLSRAGFKIGSKQE